MKLDWPYTKRARQQKKRRFWIRMPRARDQKENQGELHKSCGCGKTWTEIKKLDRKKWRKFASGLYPVKRVRKAMIINE